MLNFLKKKSKLFLVFLAIASSFLPFLNFPAPVYAAGTEFRAVLVQLSTKAILEPKAGFTFTSDGNFTMQAQINNYSADDSKYTVTITHQQTGNQVGTRDYEKGLLVKDASQTFAETRRDNNWNVELQIQTKTSDGRWGIVSKAGIVTNGSGEVIGSAYIEANSDGGYSVTETGGDDYAEEGEVDDDDIEGSADEVEEGEEADPEVASDSKAMEKKCKKIVGALGWIMCPLVFTTARGVSNLYSFVEEKFMQVNSSVFSADLSKAWGTFRNIANIFFVVLFMVVILSQLTGIGIDNYGIKRILPKIFIVAVLINLSYIACQLVTDVSNIVGAGIEQTVSGLGGEYKPPETDNYIQIALSTKKSYFIRINLAQGILGVVGAGELFVVLLCLLIALLSTFIIWIFCLARDIGIVAMVMLSPLAFACMLLPNTEGLYKKWVSLSKIVWTLYPICGLTLGTGAFVSKFVYNSTGASFLSGVGALLTLTLPFVAIPYLLLNMLSAFGTIGNKISNWGRSRLNAGWRGTGRIATTPARVAGKAAGAGLRAGALASGVATAGIAKHTLAAIKSGGTGVANKRRQAALEQQLKNATTDEARQQIQEKMAQSQAKYDEAIAARKEAGKEARSSLKGVATDAASSAWATMRTGAAERNKARVAEAQRREEVAKWAKGSTVSDIMERQAVARQNTEIKEEQARNATLDKGVVMEKLRASAAALQTHPQGSAAYQTTESQIIAAIRDVREKGGKDNLVDWARNNPTQLTPRLIQELSGVSPEFKEYAKALSPDKINSIQITDATTGNQRAMNFAEFYSSGKLSGALAANGPAAFASFDKDNWKVLADVTEKQAQSNPGQAPAVLANMPAGSLASAFVNATDGKTIDAQIKVTNNLTDQQRAAIIQEISPEQYTKLSNGIKIALAGANNLSGVDLTNKVREAFNAQITEVESNDRLRSRISPTDVAGTNNMQGPPRPPADQTRIDIPHGNSNSSPNS